MKPITDEIVLSLIERAERRQRAYLPANDTAPITQKKPALTSSGESRVISLDFVRRATRAHETVSGVFCYAPR